MGVGCVVPIWKPLRLHAFSSGELTEHKFVSACFSAAEQVSEIQAN